MIHGPLQRPYPGIVLTDAGLVILDPGASVQSGEMVLSAVSKLTRQPVVAVLFGEGLSDFEAKDTVSAKRQAYADREGFDVQLGKHISSACLKIGAAAF
ncbi:MAG TPA: hypothetical protein VLB10_08090 [Gammaproteobacteria bacterium]|nr:hypothetical protein [Gammaproteobacteria bacterium]